jgi:hypothetical protein
MVLTALACASALRAAEVVRCGAVQFSVPEGCHPGKTVNIDPSEGEGCQPRPPGSAGAAGAEALVYHLGSLVCDGGRLTIRYDIGGNAGDYCGDAAPLEFRFRENGPLVRLCQRVLDPTHRNTRKPVLALVVPDVSANFWSDRVDPAHVISLLSLGRSIRSSADAAGPPTAGAPGEGREQSIRMTRAALESLRRGLDRFRLSLEYRGPDPGKYSSLRLTVGSWPDEPPASHSVIQIDQEQAAAILGYLAADGFLYRGAINREKQLVEPEGPHYLLVAQVRDGEQYFEFLPWTKDPYRWHWMERPPLAEQLARLRAVLVGEAARAVDTLAAAVQTGISSGR